jgi:hypothetical protein
MMCGNGEVRVNGVCKDNACKTPDVKVMAIERAVK